LPKGKQNFKLAAISILKNSKRALTPREIFEAALKKNLIKFRGKTPAASMRSILSRDIKSLGKNSPFKRERRGRYGLKYGGKFR